MRRWIVVAGLAACFAAAAGGARAADNAPWKTMRALQGLEDRIAAGDAVAQAARTKALMRLGHGFAALPAETWRDGRNARALVTYLLGGGDAATISRAVRTESVSKDVAALYEGAIAYASGDDEAARGALLPIAAKTLPSGVAGRVALVQATLIEATDKAKAQALLDLARLLEPGTLVEEAALRKQMSLIGVEGDIDKLLLLERRYQAAFVRSVYAENFKQLVASFAVRAAEANDARGNDNLAHLLMPLERDDRRRLFLAIARKEVLAGHLVSAPFAATEGGKLAARDSRDASRADLYLGAASLVGISYDKAVAVLKDAQPDRLEERDRNLRLAALDMAATMRAVAAAGPVPLTDGETALLAKGDTSLASAEAELRRVKP